MAKFPPLRKVIDDDRWDAADLLGRLALIAHAAFLYTGFLPYGTKKISVSDGPPKQARRTAPSSFTCRYTLPELVARRKGVDTAVLRLSKQGGGCVLLKAYVTGSDGSRRCAHGDRLDAVAVVAPALSGGLDDAARVLRLGNPGAWLWRALADGLCWDLFIDVCGSNGVPVEPGFASFPGDVVAAILERVHDARDLARVECAGRELRRVAVRHDTELWKARYEAVAYKPERSKEETFSWKERFVRARYPPPSPPPRQRSVDTDGSRAAAVRADPADQTWGVALARRATGQDRGPWQAGGAQNDGYRKGHAAGVIHSPSSRYR